MIRKILEVVLAISLLPVGGWTQSTAPLSLKDDLEEGLYARFDTTEGKILVRLFDQKTSVTVQNFAALAKGDKEFVDP